MARAGDVGAVFGAARGLVPPFSLCPAVRRVFCHPSLLECGGGRGDQPAVERPRTSQDISGGYTAAVESVTAAASRGVVLVGSAGEPGYRVVVRQAGTSLRALCSGLEELPDPALHHKSLDVNQITIP